MGSALLTPTDGLPVLAVRQAFNVLAGSPDADAAGRLALFRDVVTQLKTAVAAAGAAAAASTAAAAAAAADGSAATDGVTAAAAATATASTTATANDETRRPSAKAKPGKPWATRMTAGYGDRAQLKTAMGTWGKDKVSVTTYVSAKHAPWHARPSLLADYVLG